MPSQKQPQSVEYEEEQDLLISNLFTRRSTELDPDITLEPLNQDAYDLSYTCLLIPRFPGHELKGDMKRYLPDWLQQICVSYGWRLEFESIQSDYMQWALRVPPSTPPGHIMQVFRQETSSFILSNFPRFKNDNLGGDFWAPGYLIITGVRPHPTDMIRQFINSTRRQQGLER